MKGVLWVQLNGMDKPAAIGRGEAVQQGTSLSLFDEDRNVIGQFDLDDVRSWWVETAAADG